MEGIDTPVGMYGSSVSLCGRVMLRAPTVDVTSRARGLATADAIRSDYHAATGVWCSVAEALAAAHSVPHGAPIAMAADNVGVAWRDLDADAWERTARMMRALR